MDEITILLDVGNCLFFFGGFPQLVKTIKNRKTLKDLSALTFSLYTMAAFLFVIVGVLLGSWMTFIFNGVNTFYFCAIIYWIKRSGQKSSRAISAE
jgi:uncharacterized protein with PQ loop repeat